MKKFSQAEDVLTAPQLASKDIVHPHALKFRKKLHIVCNNFPIDYAAKAILHCIAPTGTGKTISCSLLGARMASAEDHIEHLIFATPYILLTEQAETVLKRELLNTSISVAKTHSKMAYASEAERKKAKRLGFDVTICTTQKLHLALLGYRNHKGARYNLQKSVIIIDDASQYLKPEIASAILILLDELRKKGARIIMASATLPHYETIPNYLPKSIKIHRFGEEILKMPGIKNRCRIQTHTRPVGIDHLLKIVKKEAKPSLIICETVKKCTHVFNEIKMAMPQARLFLINSKQSKQRKKQDIAVIENALKSRGNKKIIIVSTSTTHAGWDVSFASGINDTFDTIMALEHRGRVNRALEFGPKCVLHCMNIQVPGINRNTSVDTSRRIAMALMENNQFNDPMAPTIAAQMELEERNGVVAKEAKKAALAAKKGNLLYLRKHLKNIDYRGKGTRSVLPPATEIPALYVELKKLFTNLGLRCQILKDGNIRLKEKISHDQILDILEKSNEIYEEFAIEIDEKRLQDFQKLGDILQRIVYRLPNGEEVETEYYFLSPKAFDPHTGLCK